MPTSPSSSFTTSCFAPVILKCSQFLTPGEGNGNPPQSSYLENPMDGEAWRAPVHGVTKSQTRLSDKHFYNIYQVLITCQIPYILSSWVLTTTLGDTISSLQKRKMRLGRGRVVKLPKFVQLASSGCGIWILASWTLESSASLLLTFPIM